MISKVDDHGFIFKILFYVACFTTILLFTFLKPHRLYKRFISWVFNKRFSVWKIKEMKVYHSILFFILFYVMILVCNLFFYISSP